MTIGVIVIAAGRHQHLARGLAALQRQERPADRVVVVDMGSDPPLRTLVADLAPAALTVACAAGRDGLPLAAARNCGADAAGTDHLVFLDVDCIAASSLVERYSTVLDEYPVGLAVGPVRYLEPGWDRRLEGRRSPPETMLVRRSRTLPVRRPPPTGAVRVDDRHHLFWSLAFAVTRSTWEAVDGFDERYVGYGAEDTDFAMTARQRGVPMVWFGAGPAFHQWHPSTRADPARVPEIVANAQRFRARWGWWPMAGWLHELADAGVVRFEPDGDVLVVADDPPIAAPSA